MVILLTLITKDNMSTYQQIKQYLLTGRSLTVVSCYQMFGTPNLRSRLSNFKQEGYTILSEIQYKKDEKGKIISHYNKYWIETIKLKSA